MTDENDDARRTVLVLGSSGMLGHALVHELGARPELTVRGTLRSKESVPDTFFDAYADALVVGVDVLDREAVAGAIADVRPDVVINAVGVIKQVPSVDDAVVTTEINALLPHLVARECTRAGARLVQVSTDCVFSGRRGMYTEDDVPDPIDFYGRSKLLGEVGAPHVTLRTSIIGHEMRQHASLLEWFLSQRGGSVKGYTEAVYSGLTTVELARMIATVVIPRPELSGLWHVASSPITKADLLDVIAAEYDWQGEMTRDGAVRIDRSMSAARLQAETGYATPGWPEMIREMREARDRWSAA